MGYRCYILTFLSLVHLRFSLRGFLIYFDFPSLLRIPLARCAVYPSLVCLPLALLRPSRLVYMGIHYPFGVFLAAPSAL